MFEELAPYQGEIVSIVLIIIILGYAIADIVRGGRD
jgi:hypothetical protein